MDRLGRECGGKCGGVKEKEEEGFFKRKSTCPQLSQGKGRTLDTVDRLGRECGREKRSGGERGSAEEKVGEKEERGFQT